MWRGEWKAYVFRLGWPLIGLIALTVVVLVAGQPVTAASKRPPDPVAVVRAFYAQDSIRAYDFYSSRLKKLFLQDEHPGELGNLTFAFHVNAQDTEEGWQRTLRLELVERRNDRAEVRATVRNFGPQEIRYSLVRERGRWLIDDARSVLGEPWVLSEILVGG